MLRPPLAHATPALQRKGVRFLGGVLSFVALPHGCLELLCVQGVHEVLGGGLGGLRTVVFLHSLLVAVPNA